MAGSPFIGITHDNNFAAGTPGDTITRRVIFNAAVGTATITALNCRPPPQRRRARAESLRGWPIFDAASELRCEEIDFIYRGPSCVQVNAI